MTAFLQLDPIHQMPESNQLTETLGTLLKEHILDPLKQAFVGKDEIVDLMGVSLVGGENLFLLGPPGTAKSALVQALSRRLNGIAFDYLLTRFTEPNELFGPFDIRKLREGDLITNTEGMLPEADIVFLDELLNANSAILNSLLMVLNERVFRRGRETRQLPTLMVIGASNHLPEEEALAALFDRFLLRVNCDNVPQEQLEDVLHAGWQLEQSKDERQDSITIEQIRELQKQVSSADVSAVRSQYVELIQRLRHAGMKISDRRAVKYQRLAAASALLCGRTTVQPSDMWVLRYTWDVIEQQEVLHTLVHEWIGQHADAESTNAHPRSKQNQELDPEQLARDLLRVENSLQADLPERETAYLKDQLSVLASRCEWVTTSPQKEDLQSRIENVWKTLNAN